MDLILSVDRQHVLMTWLSTSVALCLNSTGVEIVGLDEDVEIAVAVPPKYPVRRKLSVDCRPASAPISRVWSMRPVDAETTASALREKISSICRVVVGRDADIVPVALTAPGKMLR